jgi:NAD(P) transhydrogenase subunit beta
MKTITTLAYLLSSVLFIIGIKNLGSPKTARRGNILAMASMLIAIVVTLLDKKILDFSFIIAGITIGSVIGIIMAKKTKITAMPQIVALFNGLGGGSSAFVALAEYYRLTGKPQLDVLISILLSLFIGALTFTGSLMAFGKLQNIFKSVHITFKIQYIINLLLLVSYPIFGVMVVINPTNTTTILTILAISSILGILFVLPIGGADMPVVISLLNSCSGLAAAATGFTLSNYILITSGALVGASGIILTHLMCTAMNRSLISIILGTTGKTNTGSTEKYEKRKVTEYTPEDGLMVFESAQSIIIVPGYGLAVSHAQYVLHDLAKALIDKGTRVRYAIHPVAGRMPGHMNVILAEANVPYDMLFDLDSINDDFQNTDAVLVIGANDVINPAARTDKNSPLYGMPILNVDKARTVIICKRSLSPGFSGIDNELFYSQKTMMIFGDAKDTVTTMVKLLKS